jgi:two-component system KDP operon response regulator KdpE
MPSRRDAVQREGASRRAADETAHREAVHPVERCAGESSGVRVSGAFARILQRSPALFAAPDARPFSALWREVVNRGLGVTPMHVAPIDLGDLLMNILPQWKTVAPRHTLELALLGDIPPVYADGEWAARAFALLIDYVVRATPQGGAARVSVRPEEDGVAARVRHFGATPSDDLLAHLLEPSGPSASAGASGLELPLAQLILEAQGGRLWAERPATGEGLSLATWWSLREVIANASSAILAGARADVEEPPADATATPSPEALGAVDRASMFDRERPVLLVVEEDARMARYLKANLDASGFASSVARGAEDAARRVDLDAPDLIILDGGARGMRDQSLLRELLARGGCPVIVLGRAHNPLACARALDAGASDWVARPFSTEELLARVRVTLRSRRGQDALRSAATIGELTFDAGGRSVRRDGRPIPLSRTELKLLRTLAARPGVALAHAELLERVWGPAYCDATDFLWVYVRRLRKKIETDPSAPRYILTVPGIGYRLAHHDEVTNP